MRNLRSGLPALSVTAGHRDAPAGMPLFEAADAGSIISLTLMSGGIAGSLPRNAGRTINI